MSETAAFGGVVVLGMSFEGARIAISAARDAGSVSLAVAEAADLRTACSKRSSSALVGRRLELARTRVGRVGIVNVKSVEVGKEV